MLTNKQESCLFLNILKATGTPQAHILLSFNRFLQWDIPNIFTVNFKCNASLPLVMGDGTRTASKCKKLKTQMTASDIVIQKPTISPLACMQERKSYQCEVYATLNYDIFDAKTDKKIDEKKQKNVRIAQIPVMIMSAGCMLMEDLMPGDRPTIEEMMRHLYIAHQRHPYDLTFMSQGIFIINGTPAYTMSRKDMNLNTLFHYYQPAKHATSIYPFDSLSNMLCSAKTMSSTNIVFMIVIENFMPTMKVMIKTKPFHNFAFDVTVLFAMYEIYTHKDIMRHVMQHAHPNEMPYVDMFAKILQTSEASFTCVNDTAAWIYNKCKKNQIVEELQNVNGQEISALTLYRLLLNIAFTNTNPEDNHERITLLSSKVYECLHSYLDFDTNNPMESKKQDHLIHRRSMENARIELPHITLTKQVLNLNYDVAKKLSVAMTNQLIKYDKNNGDIKYLSLSDLVSVITGHPISSEGATSNNMMRYNVNRDLVVDTIRKNYPGTHTGRSLNANTMVCQMIRSYVMDVVAATKYIDPHFYGFFAVNDTPEGSPGVNVLFGSTSVIVTVTPEEPNPTEMLKKELSFCNHVNCPLIYYNHLAIGRNCDPTKTFWSLFEIRRKHHKVFRALGFKLDMFEGSIRITNTDGTIFIPMIKILNNRADVIRDNNIKFCQWSAINPDIVVKIARDEISIQTLIEQGKIHMVSIYDVTAVVVCGGYDMLEKNKNNISFSYDFLTLPMQYLSTSGCLGNEFNNPPIRSGYGYSLTKSSNHYTQHACREENKRSFGLDFRNTPSVVTPMSGVLDQSFVTFYAACMSHHNAYEDASTVNRAVAGHPWMSITISSYLTAVLDPGQKLIQKDDDYNLEQHGDHFGSNGLPVAGTILKRDMVYMVYLNKNVPKTKTYKSDMEVVVMKSKVYFHKNNRYDIKIHYGYLQPFGGSIKFSMISGAKTVMSQCVQPSELPYNIKGQIPSFIFSNAVVSGRQICSNTTNAGLEVCRTGKLFMITPGKPTPDIRLSKETQDLFGVDENSMTIMYDNFGKKMREPIQVLMLDMMSINKIGPVDLYINCAPRLDETTMQPRKGGGPNEGSYKSSEMERMLKGGIGATTSLIAQNADMVEKWKCRQCNGYAINHATNGVFCRNCGTMDCVKVNMCYSYLKVESSINCCNLDMKLDVFDPTKFVSKT